MANTQVIADRLKSAALGIMFFIVFQPMDFPDGYMRYVTIGLFFLTSTVICMVCELIVTYVLKMPDDISRGMAYTIRRNWFFMPFNIVLQTIAVTTLFDVVNPMTDYWTPENIAYIVICMLFISFIQSLYWRNVDKNRIIAQELEEAWRINGILQERERNRQQRQQADSSLSPVRSSTSAASDPIHIVGTTKEDLSFYTDEFLYAESQGNYVVFHYLKADQCKTAEIRTNLTAVSEQLASYNGLMRCHRAFVVNLRQVCDVERRSGGLTMHLHHCDTPVPVSKSYLQEVKLRLQNLN